MKIYDYEGQKNICGKRVREARRKLKLSQAQLAARLQIQGINVVREVVSKIETGDRFVADFEILVLSRILGVDADWLLGEDDINEEAEGSNSNENI